MAIKREKYWLDKPIMAFIATAYIIGSMFGFILLYDKLCIIQSDAAYARKYSFEDLLETQKARSRIDDTDRHIDAMRLDIQNLILICKPIDTNTIECKVK